MRNGAKIPNNAEPKLAFVIEAAGIQLATPCLDQSVCATTLDDRNIFALELNIGIKI
jgi:hypothetical protein